MGDSRPFGARTLLLVEESAIIGLDLADNLEHEGYEVAGPFSCEAALTWVESATPDLAVLDVHLQSGFCVRLARELQRRGVPLVVHSSYNQIHALSEFQNLPWVQMPAAFSEVASALSRLRR